jgi:putative intracellular protease/amidase
MQKGLEDRRIALFAAGDKGTVTRALEKAGARVASLHGGLPTRDEDWHGAKYAALVIVDAGQNATTKEPRIVQLAREFLVSDKPIAAYGGGIQVLHEAGGLDEDVVLAVPDGDLEAFSSALVRGLSSKLEESQLDDMSAQSFPASDPPSTTPASIGPRSDSPDSDARA